jgi:hypothetical protein
MTLGIPLGAAHTMIALRQRSADDMITWILISRSFRSEGTQSSTSGESALRKTLAIIATVREASLLMVDRKSEI